MKRVLIFLLVLSVAAISLSSCSTPTSGNSANDSPAPRVGKQAPDFELTGLDGGQVSLKNLRGSPVMINFWATWCTYCRYEMPYIQQVYQDWSGRGVVVMGINLQESENTVRGFMQAYQLTFPVLLDTKGKVAEDYNIGPIPATFFIDKDGVIQSIRIGAFSNAGQIEKELNKIVK